MQHTLSGQGILRRSAAMQEYDTITNQTIANTFADANDYIWGPDLPMLAGMKASNPACDFGPYAKGIMYQGTTSGNGLPTDFPEDWYTHDTQPFAKANRVNSSFGATIWIMNPVSTSVWKDTSGEAGIVNANYSGFIAFHKQYLLDRIKSRAEYTNVFADSMGTQSMNGQRDPTTGAVETTTTWFAKLKTAFTTVQSFIHAAGFEVHPNGLVTNAGTYQYGDGAMLENALRQFNDPPLSTMSSTTLQSKFNTHGQRLMDTQLAGKAAFPLTQILSGMTHGSAAEQAWREYVAACYYLLDMGKLYWDFNCFGDAATNHGNAFSRNLKTPMDAAAITQIADLLLKAGTSGNLYGRRYVRGFALVNTSSAAISYTLPRTDYKQIDGTAQAAAISVPARTGIVLYATVDDPASGGGPPPPPPPPPDPTVFFDMDFGVNTPTTTPFGFDSLPNGVGAGAIMEVVTGTGTVGAVTPSGAGVRGAGISSAPYTNEKTAGVAKPGYMSVLVQWYKIQPVSWNAYDTSAFAGLDTMIDLAATEKIAGRPVSIGLRIMCGADAPVGGRDVDGTTLPSWMVGGASAVNNNKATDYMIWASNDGGSRLSHVPIYWNPDFSYNDAYLYHYNNLMVWLNTYLNGTTSGGNRRADYIMHVPVSAPTEVGSEMPIGMGSGGASFDPPVAIAGTTYGNGTNGAPAITDIGSVNRTSSKLHMPSTVAADTQTAQNTWLANWYHNMSTATLGGAIAPGDGAWMRAIAINMAQANFDSSVAYGFIFADNGARGLDILPRCTQWLKTKLWTGKTDGRVWPPNGDFSQPVSTWTYRNWSAAAADVLDLALSLVAPAYPLMWIQSANAIGYGGSRGMPPSDFIQTATDFMNTYKVQFFETYATVWTDPTYGAANVSFTNGTLIPKLAANAQAGSNGGAARGELHVKEVSTLATGPVGRKLIPAGNKDVWYRFVLDDFTTPSAIVSLLFSSPSGGSNNGDLSVRINTAKQLVVRWNSSSAADFTDTSAVVKGDLIEVRHYLDPAGTACGYELWVNNTLRHKNLALAAPANSTVSFVNMGLPNAVNAETWIFRFGAGNARMGSPVDVTVPTNSDSPIVNITNPANGTVYTANTIVTVSATATDNDGISLVEIQFDGGGWQPMTLQGSQYVIQASLTGTAGTAKPHTIAVRATDAYAGTQRQTTASVTVTVNIPGADVIPPNINVTSPTAQATTVANGVATQVVAGTVTDAVGVSFFQINGVDVAHAVGSGGGFSTTLPLIVGANVFTLVAKDAAGNTSTVTYTVTRQDVPINLAPSLTVTAPVDGQTYPVGTRNITLSGTASDADGTVTSVAYTYDGSAPVAVALSAGAFSKSIPVTEGGHTITVTATDNQGLTASATMNITIPSSTVVDTSQGTGFNISLDFGKGQVLVRV